MADPAHRPAGDTSFRDSLARNAMAAAGLVVLAILVFWALSALGGGDDEPVIAGPTDVPTATEQPTAGPSADPTSEPSPTASPSEAPSPVPSPEPTPTPTVTATTEPAPTSFSIQVIDGVIDDGGSTASEVTSELRSAGFSICCEVTSARYHDTTKIWYIPGHRENAEKVRAALGFGIVEEADLTRVSDSVAIHVIVGADA